MNEVEIKHLYFYSGSQRTFFRRITENGDPTVVKIGVNIMGALFCWLVEGARKARRFLHWFTVLEKMFPTYVIGFSHVILHPFCHSFEEGFG